MKSVCSWKEAIVDSHVTRILLELVVLTDEYAAFRLVTIARNFCSDRETYRTQTGNNCQEFQLGLNSANHSHW